MISEIKEKIKKILNNLSKKENIRPLLFSIIIVVFSFAGYQFLGNYFVGAIWILNTIILGTLLLIIMVLAGFTVLRSLFAVAAELSLLIFLAQSYCDIPNRSISSDDALKSLLVIGILYIGFTFFSSLWGATKEYYKKHEKNNELKEGAGSGIIFLFFTGLFMWQIYLVIYPIINNLCICG